MFTLRVLGGALLAGEDGPLSGKPVQTRRMALLVLLAANRHKTLSREKLTAYLWPERDVDKGRRLLSESLYVLRKALGEETLVSEGDSIRLDTRRVSCDVPQFRSAKEHGNLEKAVSLYGGPFLDGFFLRNAPGFHHWADGVRDSCSAEYGQALEALAHDTLQRNDLLKAVEWYRRLAAHDPYNSRYALLYMEAMAETGDPGNAIQFAKQHAEFLQQELGTGPTPELLAYVEDLQSRSVPADPSKRHSETPHPTEYTPGEKIPPQTSTHESPNQNRGRLPRGRYRWIVAGLAMVATFTLAWFILGPGGGTSPESFSLVVLPLENLGLQEDAHFAEGVSEEIRNKLSAVSALSLIGRTSARQYGQRAMTASEIGEALNVDFIIDGSVRVERRSRGRWVRARVELIRASDGSSIWSGQYENLLEGILQVQSEIAQAVVEALSVSLLPPERRSLVAGLTENLSAIDHYFLGRQSLAEWEPTEMRQAIRHLQAAVDADSTYALGYAALAWAYAALGIFEVGDPNEWWPHAREAAERALDLDDGLSEAHTALAMEAMSYRYDWEAARRGFDRALELNRSSVDALVWYALLEAGIFGRGEEAIDLIARAQRLDPGSKAVRFNSGFVRFYAGHRTDGKEMFRGLIASNPEYHAGYEGLSAALTAEGHYEEALELAQEAADLTNHVLDSEIGHLGYLYGRVGMIDEALAQLDRLDDLTERGIYVSPVSRARIHAGLGDVRESHAWLEEAYADRCHWLIWLVWESYYWEGLASDQGFQNLLRRMDFPSQFPEER